MIPIKVNRTLKDTKTVHIRRTVYKYDIIISLWNDIAWYLQTSIEDQLAESLVWKFNARHLEIKQDIDEEIWRRLERH